MTPITSSEDLRRLRALGFGHVADEIEHLRIAVNTRDQEINNIKARIRARRYARAAAGIVADLHD